MLMALAQDLRTPFSWLNVVYWLVAILFAAWAIVRPQDPFEPPVSFGSFITFAAPLNLKAPLGEWIDHIELDRRIVPEVLDRARSGQIGKSELIVAQHSDRAFRR
jgi:hypothetical protein